MGNYNCQECITKETNLINELFFDSNLSSLNKSSIEESKTYETKIKHKKINKSHSSEEDLKKLLKDKDLSEDQKKFMEKIIKKNSIDLYQKNNNDNPEEKIKDLEAMNNNKNTEAIIIRNSLDSEDKNKETKNDIPQNEEVKIEFKGDEERKKFKIESYESNNNNMDYLFEKNEREDEPQDTIKPDFRKPILPKINDNETSNKKIGPRDSLRKGQKKFIDNNNIININDKYKIPLNRGEIHDNNNNNNNMKKINIINNNQNHNKKNINIIQIQDQKFLSPPGNNKDLHLEPFDNNNIANYNNVNTSTEKERKAITLGPYLNQVEEIKNANTSGPVINGSNTNRTKNEINYNQEGSQIELEMTISDKENPLFLSDDRGGNMNYLEKRYQAYQNKMRYILGDENF